MWLTDPRSTPSIELRSRSLLDMTVTAIAFQDLAESRKGEVAIDEVYCDQPGTDEVRDVVELIGIGDAIHGRIDGKEEEEEVGDMAQPMGHIESELANFENKKLPR